MNRIKVWLYALIMVGAAAFGLLAHSQALRASALRGLDARLEAAQARAGAEERSLVAEAGAVAALAARDPKLLAALHATEPVPAPPLPRRGRAAPPPPADPSADEAATQQALRAAVAGAEAVLGFTLPEASTIAGGNREWLARKAQDTAAADKAALDLLTGAIDGKARRGPVLMNGQLWWAAAVPAGEGAGLAVFVPLNAHFAQAVARGAGVDAIVVAPGQKPITSGRAADAEALVKAASASPGVARDAGKFASAPVNLLGVVPFRNAPLLFATAPAHRVLARPVSGLKGALVVVAAPAEPALAPIVQLQWTALVLLGAALVVGLLFGLLVRPSEVAAQVPPELVAAADRIERGDFAARAPALAGKLGTIGAALNRAAAAAEAGGSSSSGPSLTQEFFAQPAAPAAAAAPAEVEPSAFEFPKRKTAPAVEAVSAAPAAATPAWAAGPAPAATAARAEPFGLGGGAFEAAPVPAPRPPTPEPAPAQAPELLQAAARAAPPAAVAVEDEEGHWRAVFQDFVRVRTECGEPAEGLTFERFRQKLETNKATLVAKYGCRTVRFQVYVKEGKAALKATPVR